MNTHPTDQTDKIEKRIVLRARLDTVWRAISDAEQFGAWFGVRFHGPFRPGATVTGTVVGTQVDDAVAAAQKAYEGTTFECMVEDIEPKRRLSFRWHPGHPDPDLDLSAEPTTLVEFTLAEVAGGTELRIVESGFDQIPLERRAQVFATNDEGWAAQAKLIENYLTRAS